MVDLNKLSPAALAAAMRGGTSSWGQWGSVLDHAVYVEPQTPNRGQYRKCHCGCGGKAKFGLMANGMCMSVGCELSMRRCAKECEIVSQSRGKE